MTATKAVGINPALMTANAFRNGCSEVDSAIAYSNENKQKAQTVQKDLHELVGAVGNLQIAVAQQQRDAAAKLRVEANSKRDHDLLVLSLGKMIFDAVKQTPATAQNATQKPADRAKEIAEKAIRIFEAQNIPKYAVFSETNKCMMLTPGVALTVIELLKVLPNCVAPDLSKFQNQILPEALGIVLANKQVSKIVLAVSAKGTPAEQVANEVRKTRQLEIVFA